MSVLANVTEYVVLEKCSLLAKIYTFVPLVTNLTGGENDRIFYLTYNLYFGDWLRQHCRLTLWKYDSRNRRNTHHHQRVSEQRSK